ncbi:uncharacterized protein A4U43_C04F35350 [Asparagus officinalis]|uniref:Uncharacterized protein n=1 Tax=Asparagus officinalis TaxID=4686 RepID=A0A5P1F5W9_ASPOF|nr:uncharacterized protein A4U43_C04F35350 [Asparagus officinalis]
MTATPTTSAPERSITILDPAPNPPCSLDSYIHEQLPQKEPPALRILALTSGSHGQPMPTDTRAPRQVDIDTNLAPRHDSGPNDDLPVTSMSNKSISLLWPAAPASRASHRLVELQPLAVSQSIPVIASLVRFRRRVKRDELD